MEGSYVAPVIVVVIASITLAALFVSKFLVKPQASVAYVRFGRGGTKVFSGRPFFCITLFQQAVAVPLKPFRYRFDRTGREGCLTKDWQRFDISVDATLRVDGDTDERLVQTVKRYGDLTVDRRALEFLSDKLAYLCRAAACKMTAEEIRSKHAGLTAEVLQEARHEIKDLGLVLDSLVIAVDGQAPTAAEGEDKAVAAPHTRYLETVREEQDLLARLEATRLRKTELERELGPDAQKILAMPQRH